MRCLTERLWVPLGRAVAAQALKTVQRPDAVSREAACGRKASALSSSACRKLGKIADHTPATTSAPTPPYTVARTAPHHCAVRPLSNSPSSLDAPIKSELTALTRPRISAEIGRAHV